MICGSTRDGKLRVPTDRIYNDYLFDAVIRKFCFDLRFEL